MTPRHFLLAPLAAVALIVAGGSVAAQKSAPSVVGVWIGQTQVPDQGTDELTLIIQQTKDGLAGTISDSLGQLAPSTEIKNLTFVKDELTGSFPLTDGSAVSLTLKLDGDTMKGKWTHEEGGEGEITLERKKKG